MMRVTYEGSPIHKRYPSRWGAPAFRSDKTECPTTIAHDQASEVLTEAIIQSLEQGVCSVQKDGNWPRYVWGRSQFLSKQNALVEIVWEARVSNFEIPTYKAYPVQVTRHSDHMSPEIEEKLWPES